LTFPRIGEKLSAEQCAERDSKHSFRSGVLIVHLQAR
jgi:hypothetical protein